MSINIDYATYTKNELGHELINVIVKSDNGPIEALFKLNRANQYYENIAIQKDIEKILPMKKTFSDKIKRLFVK